MNGPSKPTKGRPEGRGNSGDSISDLEVVALEQCSGRVIHGGKSQLVPDFGLDEGGLLRRSPLPAGPG